MQIPVEFFFYLISR